MALPANNIVEVQLGVVANSQQLLTVLHYHAVGDTVGFLPNDLMDGLLTVLSGVGNGEIQGEFRKVMSEDVTLNFLSVQLVWPVRYIRRKLTTTTAGLIASDIDRQNTNPVITKYGELASRSNVGSVHVPGMPNNAAVGGVLTAGYTTLLNTLVTDFLSNTQSDGLSAAEYDPVILNKVWNPITEKYEISGYTPVKQWAVQDTVRTMNRRTLRRGI